MKNLLIDALRQAGDREQPPDLDAAVVGPPKGEPQIDDSADRGKDLELLESTVLTESMRLASTAADDAVGYADEDEIVDDPTVLVPSLSLSHAPEQGAVNRATVPSSLQPTHRPNERSLNRDLPMLLGRWSPALCLIAMSATSGLFWGYQKLTAQAMNPELGTLPAAVEQDVDEPPFGSVWHALSHDGERLVGASLPSVVETLPISSDAKADPAREGRTAAGPQATRTPASPRVEQTGESNVENTAFADVQAGFQAYANGDFNHAEGLYRAALSADPNYGQALAGLATVLQRMARIEESIPIYERLLILDPQDVRASAFLLAHAKSGESAENETRVKVLLQRHPDTAALHFAMGLMMAERSRWAEAHQAFLRANSLVPDNADYSYNVAVSAERLGQIETARTYYEATLAVKGDGWLFDRQTVSRQLRLLSTERGNSS